MGGLRRQFLESELITTNVRTSDMTNEKRKNNVKKWVSFF